MDLHSQHGIWYDLTPKKLAKKDQQHPWLFAEYFEAPSEREDARWYKVFLFRDKERITFGLKEYWELPNSDFRDLATRVVQDKDFRESLISEDPDLPKIWKRRN